MKSIAAETIMAALGAIRVSAMSEEYDIHSMIARALDDAGIEYVHEYRLAPRCRLDFFAGGVAIEVKKGRPGAAKLHEQLARYMVHPDVREMIVVTPRQTQLPAAISGKPVHGFCLNKLWGVALP